PAGSNTAGFLFAGKSQWHLSGERANQPTVNAVFRILIEKCRRRNILAKRLYVLLQGLRGLRHTLQPSNLAVDGGALFEQRIVLDIAARDRRRIVEDFKHDAALLHG